MSKEALSEEDVVKRLESWGVDDADSEELYALLADASREIQRLREVVTFPIITPDAPPGFYLRVLTEHEKGQPVNAQDLINALMWRVRNQRREIARLHEPQRKAYSDPKGGPEYDAP